MKKRSIALCTGSIIVILLAVYRRWFSCFPLSAGDWSFHFSEEIRHFMILPSSWIFWFGGGLGGNGVFLTGLETYFLATARVFTQWTGLSWAVYERIFWYIPFLLIGTYASVYLAKTILPYLRAWWLTPVIFLTNTYILMITGGGQMGIAMAYAVAPLVFAQFIKLFEHPTVRRGIRTGLMLSLLILFDPRIAYVLMAGVMLCGIILRPKRTFIFAFPLVCAGFIHAFWIVPLVVFRINPIESLGSAYNSIEAVKFFSFADFSHTLALLHPNWPENLFGKVYFLQPEFLVIPILAMSALLHKKIPRQIISMGFVAIAGAFLAKGANPPVGGIYLWLFRYIPGFNVFRDPTKFYLLTAIAYSVLIPFALERTGKKILSIVFLLFWLITIRQAVTGHLGGTFISRTVPYDYEVLKTVINQPEYFRTFWIPHVQKYAYSSYMHPAIDGATVLNTSSPSAILTWLRSQEGKQQLARWSVKYVILPYDSQGEIFLDDRKYSEKVRGVFQKALDENTDMRKITADISSKISVYEVDGYKDHFWFEEENARIVWRMISPTLYEVTISGLDRPGALIFSESYDPYWQVTINGKKVSSDRTIDSLNSFRLPPVSSASGILEYLPQRYVQIGLVISIITCATIVVWMARKYPS